MFQDDSEGASVGGEKKDIKGVKLNVDVDFSEYITGLGTAKDIAAVLKSNTIDIFSEFASSYSKLENQARQVATLFGGSRAFAQDLKRSIADVTPEIVALGGSMQDVRDMQLETMKNMNTQITLSKDQTTELFAASSLVAGTGENIGKVSADAQRKFVDAGYSISDTGSQLLGIINTARELGVSTVSVYKQIGESISKLNLYNFEGGVQGMARMAAEASLLRIDMKTTLSLADKLYDPDQAIKMAASFNRLGVQVTSLLDPYKLMDMARNDPEKLQAELGKALSQYTRFNEETGKMEFTDFGRGQIRELSKDLGISTEQLAQWGIATADISRKMSEIKFPSEFASEKDRKMIAGLAHMATEGEFKGKYVVNIGGQEKLVSQLDKDDRAAIEKGAEPAKTAVELQLEANGLLASLVNYAKAGIGVGGLQLASSQKVGNVMDTYFGVQQDITKATTSFITGMETKKTGPGAGSLPDVQGVKDRLKGIEENAYKIMDAAVQGNGEAISEVLTSMGKEATGSLEKNYKEAINGIKERLEKEGMSKTDIEKIMSGMGKIGENIGVVFKAQVEKSKKDLKTKAEEMGLTPEVQAEIEKKYDNVVKKFGEHMDVVNKHLSSFSDKLKEATGVDIEGGINKGKEAAKEMSDAISETADEFKEKAAKLKIIPKEEETTKPELKTETKPEEKSEETKVETTKAPTTQPQPTTTIQEFKFSKEGLTTEEQFKEIREFQTKMFGKGSIYGGETKKETIPTPKPEDKVLKTIETNKVTEVKTIIPEKTEGNRVTTSPSFEPPTENNAKISVPTETKTENSAPKYEPPTSGEEKETSTLKTIPNEIVKPEATKFEAPPVAQEESQKMGESIQVVVEQKPEATKFEAPPVAQEESQKMGESIQVAAEQKPEATKFEAPPVAQEESQKMGESIQVVVEQKQELPIETKPVLSQEKKTEFIPPPELVSNENEFKIMSEDLGEVITRTIKTPDLTPQFQIFADSYGGKLRENIDQQTSTLTEYASSITKPPTPTQTKEEEKTTVAPNLSQVSVREIIDMMPKSEITESLISKVLEKKPEIAELKGIEGFETLQKEMVGQLKKDRDNVVESYLALTKILSEDKTTETDKISIQLQKDANNNLTTLINYSKAQLGVMSIEQKGTPIENLVSTGVEPYVTESALEKIMSKKEVVTVEQKPQTQITELKPIIQTPEPVGLNDGIKKIEETVSSLKTISLGEKVEISVPETTGKFETPPELTTLTSIVGQSVTNTNSLISTLGKPEETKTTEPTTVEKNEVVETTPIKSYGEDYLGKIEKQIATIIPLRTTAEVVPTIPESPSMTAVEKINEKTTTETLSKSEHKSEVNGNIKFDFNINQTEFMSSLMKATNNSEFVTAMNNSLSKFNSDRAKILGMKEV